MASRSAAVPTRRTSTIRAGFQLPPAHRRTARHCPYPRDAGRQDRAEPADERDAGGDGAGAVQILVRGFRSRPRQSRRPRPRPAQTHRRPLPGCVRGLRTGRNSKGMEDFAFGKNYKPASARYFSEVYWGGRGACAESEVHSKSHCVCRPSQADMIAEARTIKDRELRLVTFWSISTGVRYLRSLSPDLDYRRTTTSTPCTVVRADGHQLPNISWQVLARDRDEALGEGSHGANELSRARLGHFALPSLSS